MMFKRPFQTGGFCIALLAGLLCQSCPSNAQKNADPAWLHKNVTMDTLDPSLAALAAEFADKTGQSLLIEGQPLDRKISVKATDSADKMLTAFSQPFGYDWTLSKSGVVLLRKRFVDRQDMPEFDAAELQAATTEVLNTIRTVLPDVNANQTISELFPQLMRSLNQEQLQFVSQGGQLKVSSLSPEQQRLGTQLIYTHLLEPVYTKWKTLQQMLRGLPRCTLQRRLQPFNNASSSAGNVWIDDLIIPLGDGTNAYFAISRETIDKNAGPMDPLPAASTETLTQEGSSPTSRGGFPANASDLMLGPCTAGQLVSALRTRFGVKITLPAAATGRRLIAEMRRTDTVQALSALAELHDWALTRVDANNYLLLRRSYQAPQNMREVGLLITSALPADLQRFLLAEPAPDTNENVARPPAPQFAVFLNQGRVQARTRHLEQVEMRSLDNAVRARICVHPLAYSALTPVERRRCVAILTLNACEQTNPELTHLLADLTPAQLNPAEAFLSYSNGLLLLGGFGISFDLNTLSTKSFPVPTKPAGN